MNVDQIQVSRWGVAGDVDAGEDVVEAARCVAAFPIFCGMWIYA